MIDFKQVVRVISRRVGVSGPTVARNVVPLFGLVGIFFRATREDMLEKVCKSLAILGVAERADGNRHGGGRLVQIGV